MHSLAPSPAQILILMVAVTLRLRSHWGLVFCVYPLSLLQSLLRLVSSPCERNRQPPATSRFLLFRKKCLVEYKNGHLVESSVRFILQKIYYYLETMSFICST